MGSHLENLRRKAGYTMQQLADLAGTTAPQINKLEKGQRDLDKKWALRLAPYLGVTAEELIFPSRARYAQKSGSYQDLREVPVYGVSAGRDMSYAISKSHIIGKKKSNSELMGANGFYVTVIGDSMEPLFEEGQVLAVNPDQPLLKGKPCLIETVNNETLIRKFISRNEKILQCQQMNPPEKHSIKLAEIVRVSRIVAQEF